MPKIVDHAQKHKEIAAATCRTIADVGLGATTIRVIARASNCTTGMITHYFPNKNSLLVAAAEYAMELQINRIKATARKNPHDILGILAASLPILKTDQMIMKVWMAVWAKSVNHPQLAEFHVEAHQKYLKSYQNLLIASGSYSPSTAAIAAGRLQIYINGLSIRAILEPKKWPRRRQIAEIDDYLNRLRSTTDESILSPT